METSIEMDAKRGVLEVECVLDVRNGTGESPAWSARERALYWVDITAAQVHRWRPVDGTSGADQAATANAIHDHWQLPAVVGSLGLRAEGGLVLALRSGLHLFDLAGGELTLLCHPEADRPGNRYNDGRVSPNGRFWVGTMDDRPQKEPTGSLYRLDADHRCTRMDEGLIVSNGLAFSPDGRTLYHSDSRAASIYCRDHDLATGAIGPRRLFATVPPEHGRPDGAAVDVEGCYWSCGIGAGRLNRYSPEGRLFEYVELPVTHPTMPCFGGPDLRTLYLTSMREGLPAETLARTPQAGGLFSLRPGIAGLPTALYLG